MNGQVDTERSDLIDGLARRGWVVLPDEDSTMLRDLGDRRVRLRFGLEDSVLALLWSVATAEFDRVLTAIRGVSEREFPIVHSDLATVHLYLTEENIQALSDEGVSWAASLDLHDVYEADVAEFEAGLSTVFRYPGLVMRRYRYVACLAMLGRTDTLEQLALDDPRGAWPPPIDRAAIERAMACAANVS